eukprot:scaffold125857_cov35-Tisochrysis_lutea.AAC.3
MTRKQTQWFHRPGGWPLGEGGNCDRSAPAFARSCQDNKAGQVESAFSGAQITSSYSPGGWAPPSMSIVDRSCSARADALRRHDSITAQDASKASGRVIS